MNTTQHIPVLAIDGGGTRCRVALDGAERIIVETGSANVSTDFDGAVAQLRLGLEELAARLDQPVETLWSVPAFIGLAGVTGPEMAGRLRAALPFDLSRFEDDRPAALQGALGSREGVIAHCGTGSFYASLLGTEMRFAGGWGPVIGDEASAQWVGRKALQLTLEAADGRRAPTELTDALLGRYASTAGLVRAAGRARPADFGALAPLVTALAADGDETAMHIMALGADDIARALPRIGWSTGLTICLTGGIGPHYSAYLPDPMRAALAPPNGTPLDGAVRLARDLAQSSGPRSHPSPRLSPRPSKGDPTCR